MSIAVHTYLKQLIDFFIDTRKQLIGLHDVLVGISEIIGELHGPVS
jgi:hypothetical protein